jgi:hypothetical protein
VVSHISRKTSEMWGTHGSFDRERSGVVDRERPRGALMGNS